ncbi:MAG: flavodoxin family protein [Oscillospiraceae bacterium]|nr:flavodoxin family protein [Oscillospiraceae bacterium]
MKVITVTGSPHKNGNTNKVIAAISKGAREAGHEVIHYDVNDINPVTCQGCLECRKHNCDCVVDDGLKSYFPLLHEAGALVVGGPIYAGGLSGNLISYMNRHYSMLDRDWKVRLPAGIQLIGVVSQGRAEPGEYADFAKWFFDDFVRRDMQWIETFYACGNGPIDQTDPALLEKAYALGKALAARSATGFRI